MRMSAIVEKFKSQGGTLKARSNRNGRVVAVYDGRSWPVVKCGAVYVTDEDRTKTVTKNILAQSTGGEDKKAKSSKYTLAVGSSFGHIHSFLKDSDNVLKSLDKNQTEDKCLMLIRKPKSASKQMLKAYSWADLSGHDLPLRTPDGTLTKDVYQQFKNRGKRKPDLSLPLDETSRGQHSPRIANRNHTLKPSSNQNSSVLQLSSTVNIDGKTTSKSPVPDSSLSQTFPFDKHSGKNGNESTDRMKTKNGRETRVSGSDTHDSGGDITTNNGMGSIISHKSSKSKKSPPTVPQKPSRKSKIRNDSSQPSRQANDRPRSFNSDSNISSINKPDVIAHVSGSANRLNGAQKQENVKSHGHGSRAKHDSGRHSDMRLDSDMMYQQGFKQELNGSANSRHVLTSSPVADVMRGENARNNNFSKQRFVSASCDNLSVMRPEPQIYSNGQSSSNRSRVTGDSGRSGTESDSGRSVNGSDTQKGTRKQVVENIRAETNYGLQNSNSARRSEHQGYGSYSALKSSDSDSYAVINKQNQQQYREKEKNYQKSSSQSQHYNGRVPSHYKSSPHIQNQNYNAHSQQTGTNDNCGKTNSPQTQEYGGSGSYNYQKSSLQQQQSMGHVSYSKQNNDTANGNSPTDKKKSRSGKDYNKRKSLGDICEGKIVPTESEEPVFRAQSMGDLSAGCTFSIVGQKKMDGFQSMGASEFSGSQMVKHFRKYRELKDTQHGSLPFRGKSFDEVSESDGRPKLENMQFQSLSIKDNDSNLSTSKPKHYGSLQHLPSESSKESRRQAVPITQREQTPLKPRRCLPQVPGDVDERKKHYSDLVKVRASATSFSSASPSTSSRAGSSVMRQGGVSATPSDREVSDLLVSNHSNYAWTSSSDQQTCNNNIIGGNFSKSHMSLPDSYYDNSRKAVRKTESMGSHDHQTGSEYVAPSGGRLSDIEQTTLTSQSTTDSGYITTDPEQEALSTSSYALTLKQSAQSMYSGKKLFKPSRGDNSQVYTNRQSKGNNSGVSEVNGMYNNAKGGNSQFSAMNDNTIHHDYSKGDKSRSKSAKDSHTRSWVEKQTPYAVRHNSIETGNKQSHELTDSNNNKGGARRPEKVMTELDLSNKNNNSNTVHGSDNVGPLNQVVKKQNLSYHSSELSARDVEKLTQKSKGKSISMSQGLNLLENPSFDNKSNMLSKSHPKFTGSLKDLLGEDRHIVPIESLKKESYPSNSTLPGSWKFQGGNRPETSLKMFGKPSLFQLLQNYNLYPVRVVLPENFNILEHLRMIDCEVVLPKPFQYEKESPMSPKGSYAKLGGPNSAFKPVASGGGGPIGSVSMVTVMEVSNQIRELFETGFINKGDLIVEVNEKLMMGEDLGTLTTMLQSCQGELLLTIARDKARDRNWGSSTPTDEDFRMMEQKINELTKELRKRDNTLRQMNALMPWKQTKKGQSSDEADDPYICHLSDDEFIV